MTMKTHQRPHWASLLSPRPAAEWQRAETELEGGEASVTSVCSARLMLAASGSARSFLSFLQCSVSLTPYGGDDKVCLALLMLADAGRGALTVILRLCAIPRECLYSAGGVHHSVFSQLFPSCLWTDFTPERNTVTDSPIDASEHGR